METTTELEIGKVYEAVNPHGKVWIVRVRDVIKEAAKVDVIAPGRAQNILLNRKIIAFRGPLQPPYPANGSQQPKPSCHYLRWLNEVTNAACVAHLDHVADLTGDDLLTVSTNVGSNLLLQAVTMICVASGIPGRSVELTDRMLDILMAELKTVQVQHFKERN